jgi:hypothetical protein
VKPSLARDDGSFDTAWHDAPAVSAAPEPERLAGPGSPIEDNFAQQRLSAVLRVSARFDTGVPLAELGALLPPGAPGDEIALRNWFASAPHLGSVSGGRAFAPGHVAPDLADRVARAAHFRATAERLLRKDLGPLASWIRCAALTGSVPYGTPDDGDDIDFFIVTRTDTLWLFLLAATLAVRLRYRATNDDDRPRVCLNYVLDERAAEAEFPIPRGFLVAREALTAEFLLGEDYYRTLLSKSSWLRAEIPRLYDQRISGPRAAPRGRVRWWVRLANAALYPPLACYLHMIGMYRIARKRKSGDTEKIFRTEVAFRRLAVPSERFDDLSAEMESASIRARGAGSQVPTTL